MKTEDEISDMASLILNRFDSDMMQTLWNDCVELFEIWSLEPGEMSLKETSEIQLIKTAYILSKLAEHFGKEFVKITKKAPKFWEHCQEIVKKVEADGC
jgi:hypothetical protein